MSKFQRFLIIACGLLVLGQSFWLWQSTGRRWFTQYYRADLDPANTPRTALDATLEAAGFYDAGGTPEQTDFQFRLGLVPSGFGKQMLSVVSLGGLGLLPAAIASWPRKATSPKP